MVFRMSIHLNIELQIPVIYRADLGLRGFTPFMLGAHLLLSVINYSVCFGNNSVFPYLKNRKNHRENIWKLHLFAENYAKYDNLNGFVVSNDNTIIYPCIKTYIYNT